MATTEANHPDIEDDHSSCADDTAGRQMETAMKAKRDSLDKNQIPMIRPSWWWPIDPSSRSTFPFT